MNYSGVNNPAKTTAKYPLGEAQLIALLELQRGNVYLPPIRGTSKACKILQSLHRRGYAIEYVPRCFSITDAGRAYLAER